MFKSSYISIIASDHSKKTLWVFFNELINFKMAYLFRTH